MTRTAILTGVVICSLFVAALAAQDAKPASEGPASMPGTAAATGPATKAMTNAQIDELVLASVQTQPSPPPPAKLLQQPKITALTSDNVHLGGATPISNPFKTYSFRCVLLGHGMAAPFRQYAAISAKGAVIYPLDAKTQFGKMMSGEDTSAWPDQTWLDASALYVHLLSSANEDGWTVLKTPDDFIGITFNMPKAGTPQDIKRRADAMVITAPTITRKNGTVTVHFFTWTSIFGRLNEWTVDFGKEFKASPKEIVRWGGGGYD